MTQETASLPRLFISPVRKSNGVNLTPLTLLPLKEMKTVPLEGRCPSKIPLITIRGRRGKFLNRLRTSRLPLIYDFFISKLG